MKKVLIVGATSAIAHETAKLYAADGAAFALLARDMKRLEILVPDLRVRGASEVYTFAFDAKDPSGHEAILSQAYERLGGIDVALVAHGTLPDQTICQSAYASTDEALTVNFLSPVACITYLANLFEKNSAGKLAVISSVAGDRGRQSNYIYGSAKGGLSVFLGGVRNRLARVGVQVLTVKPGFVETPMTVDIEKGKLFVGPEIVAKDIFKALTNGKANVLYTPWFWRYIMLLVIVMIPEGIFKKLKL